MHSSAAACSAGLSEHSCAARSASTLCGSWPSLAASRLDDMVGGDGRVGRRAAPQVWRGGTIGRLCGEEGSAYGVYTSSALQALQREYLVLPPHPHSCPVKVARQQLVAEAADRFELGRGICWVRDDLQDVALQRQDKNSAPLQRGVVVVVMFSLNEVEAVLRNAKAQGRPPLTRDRAAVLPSE
eukprot:scaffold1452_cov64-Phaeocystis_antarctica.AAC.8